MAAGSDVAENGVMILIGKHEKRHQVIPDPRVVVKEWDIDGYPASIFVQMSDNITMEFIRKFNDPHRAFEAAMKNLERMETR